MRIIRQITYDYTSQEQLDRQMSRSLPDGVRCFGINQDMIITIQTVVDERIVKIDPTIPKSVRP